MSLNDLATQFYMRNSCVPGAMLAPLQLPGLRAFWHVSAFNSNSQFISVPISEQMTMSGTVTQSVSSTWPVVPYITIDATSKYYSKADDAIISPTGDMTVGAWIMLTASGTKRGILNKWEQTAANARSYALYSDVTDAATFDVAASPGAAADAKSVAGSVLQQNVWEFVVGRIECGVSQGVYVSGTWTSSAVGVPADVSDEATSLYLGRWNEASANTWDGRVSQFWICGYAVPSSWIDWLWHIQGPCYGRF